MKKNATKGRRTMTKSELIRKLTAAKKSTSEIRSAVEKKGFTVYYSEIYRAQQVEA